MDFSKIVEDAAKKLGGDKKDCMKDSMKRLLRLKEEKEESFIEIASKIACRDKFTALHGFEAEDFAETTEEWDVAIPLLAKILRIKVDDPDHESECAVKIMQWCMSKGKRSGEEAFISFVSENSDGSGPGDTSEEDGAGAAQATKHRQLPSVMAAARPPMTLVRSLSAASSLSNGSGVLTRQSS